MANDPRVPPVDAANLRALAEAADGQRDMPLVAIRDKATSKLTLARGNIDTHPESVFLVSTADSALARLKSFKVEITPEDGTPTDLTRNHDAVFWTSSCIRKFVVPYYAGHVDGRVAQALVELYDKTPEALALLHSPPSDPTLFLADTVRVVVKSATIVGDVEVLSVDQFFTRYS